MTAALRHHGVRNAFATTLAAAALAPIASADVSPFAIDVQVSSSLGSGELQVDVLSANFEADTGWMSWSQTTPVQIRDPNNNQVIATLQSATLTVLGPNVTFNATVRAGAADATVALAAVELGFEPVAPGVAIGRATAAVSVTDTDNNGATVRGVGAAGTGVFRARTNHGAQNFSTLVSQVTVGPMGTAAGSQNDPPVGFRTVNWATNEMDSLLSFTLTRNDIASATTTYELRNVPDFQLFFDGDLDCDRRLTFGDVAAFVGALIDGQQYDDIYPQCSRSLADVNADNVISVTDIGEFVGLLLHIMN